MDNVDQQLKRMGASAEEINAESDTLRKNLNSLEERINKMNLGVEGSIGIWGYGRLAPRRWGFYKEDPTSTKRKPLCDFGRQDRIAFSGVTVKLLDWLEKRVLEEKDRIGKANQTLATEMDGFGRQR